MENKEIQRQRIKRYFINAAKEVIIEEGIKGLTVRKVGVKAGYSYATIYNYFTDLNTLIVNCVFDFLEDCYQYMISFKNDEENCKQQIIIYSKAYFKYFVKNPNMFQIIFYEDLGNAPEDFLKNEKQSSVGLLLRNCLSKCAKEGYILEKDVRFLHDLIGSSIHGKLLLYLKGRNTENCDDMIAAVENEIEYLIGKGE